MKDFATSPLNARANILATIIIEMVLVLLFSSKDTMAQQRDDIWATFGPYIGNPNVNVMLVDPNNRKFIYAGTMGGFFRSDDFGLTWEQANAPMDDKQVTTLLSVKGSLYAGTDKTGVFSSTDFGLNWKQAEPPMNNKRVTTLLAALGKIYAGTDENGVFVSEDGGVNWNSTALNNKTVSALLFVDGTLYAGTNGNGVWRSKDGGVTWSQNNTSSFNDKSVTTLLATKDAIYAGTVRSGIFRSINGGDTWIQAKAPMDNKIVNILIVVNNVLFAGTSGFHPGFPPSGIFYSDDSGMTWTQAASPGNSGIETQYINSIIAEKGKLYAGTAGGVFYSTDNGKKWQLNESPLNEKWVETIIAIDDTIFAGTSKDGIYRSTDAGQKWFTTAQLGGTIIDRIVANLNFLVVGSPQGIFSSSNGGSNWVRANSPMEDKIVTALYADGGTLYASARTILFSGDLGLTIPLGILFSRDGGKNWTQSRLDSVWVTAIIAVDGFIYAGISDDGIFRSNDGMNWTRTTTSVSDVDHFLYVNNALYAGTQSNGVYRSTNRGFNWTQTLKNERVATMINVGDTLYVGTDRNGIYRSTNGINWTQANPPMRDKNVTTIVAVDGILYAGTTGSFPNEIPLGIYYSKDHGINWTQAKPPMDDKFVLRLIGVGKNLYAGTAQHGVFLSMDKGVSWNPLNSGLGLRTVNEMAYFPVLNRLYAATSNGVYFRELDSTPPTPDSLKILGTAFTRDTTITLIPFGVANEADSMIFAEETTFKAKFWEEFNPTPRIKLSRDDGPKTIHAKFKDISWNESQIVSTKITLDRTKPSYRPRTPPVNAKISQSVTISQQIDDANLDKVTLYYRRGGEIFNDDRAATFRVGNAKIDSVFITNRGIDYRIVAVDKADNNATLQNGTLDFFSIPVELGVNDLGSSPGFPAGPGGSSYRLVSVPMKLNGTPSVKSAVGIRGKYGKDDDWRFWIYQGNEQWREGDDIPLQNGEGYFLIQRNGGTLTNKVAGTTMETTAGVLGTIPGWRVRANDWTIIGNPYNTRIELSQLKLTGQNQLLSAPEMNARIWAYEGSSANQGWTNEGIALERWTGLAIYSMQADTIVFANAQDPYVKGLSKASTSLTDNLQENEWLVQIRAESGDYSDNVNYFGVRKDANVEQDVYDWYEPPIFPGGISVNFPQAEWQNSASFTSDIRPISPNGYKWQFRVNANGGTAVTLNFQQLETVPSSVEVFLLDESNHLLRDLRTQPQIEVRIPQESDTKNLVILVGKHDFVQSHAVGMRAIPQSFVLQQNYPNPFNPSTVIRYELPVAGKVTLKLFNLLGKEVMALENGEPRGPGYYEKVVDMSSFSSGIYFYRISVSGEKRFEAVKKMVFAK